jgi:hypothetical protein
MDYFPVGEEMEPLTVDIRVDFKKCLLFAGIAFKQELSIFLAV